MVIVTPVLGALVGTAWAISHPSEFARHGVVVLARQSFVDVLLLALAGTAVGVIAVGAILFWGALAWYRLSRYRDREWCATHECHGERHVFALRPSGYPPALPDSLGYVEAAFRRPRGVVEHRAYRDLNRGGDPEGWWFFVDHPDPGAYEVRWYGGRKRHEVTRETFVMHDT